MIALEVGRDGRATLGRLEECDGQLLDGFLKRLSPTSVYRRFFSPLVRADLFKASLLTNEQYERDSIAALQDGEVVALVQYSRRVGSDEAEMAIVVADAWQRQGLGTRLVAALADRAAAGGITAFAVSIQGDNPAAVRLLKRTAPGTRLAFAAGVGEGVIPLEVGK